MNYSEIPNFLYFSQEPREREPREQILKSSEPRERCEFTGFNPVKEKLWSRASCENHRASSESSVPVQKVPCRL